jgi:hypothetical protein
MSGTASTTTTPPAEPAAQGGQGGQAPAAGGGSTEQRLTGLETKLDELAALVRGQAAKGGQQVTPPGAATGGNAGAPSTETAAGRAESLRAEIAAELGKLREQEKHDAEAASQADRLKKVEEALERAPRQFRKVERVMGWVHKDDE